MVQDPQGTPHVMLGMAGDAHAVSSRAPFAVFTARLILLCGSLAFSGWLFSRSQPLWSLVWPETITWMSSMDVHSPLAECAFQLRGNQSCHGGRLSSCVPNLANANLTTEGFQRLRAGVLAPACGAAMDQSWRTRGWMSPWDTELDFAHWSFS